MKIIKSYIIRPDGDLTPAVCSKCLESKPPLDYYLHSKREDGFLRYRPTCKACRIKGGRKNWPRPKHSKFIESGKQECKICGIEKTLSEYYKKGCFTDGTQKYQNRCKSCILELSKKIHIKQYPSTTKKRSDSPKNFITTIINKASRRKTHLGFDIDIMYLLEIYSAQKGLCAISGVLMTHKAGQGRVNTNISIDRIDSSRGYLKNNIQLVCDMVNRMKSNMSQTEFVGWCKHIVKAENEKI
jgi:hypothetical protein